MQDCGIRIQKAVQEAGLPDPRQVTKDLVRLKKLTDNIISIRRSERSGTIPDELTKSRDKGAFDLDTAKVGWDLIENPLTAQKYKYLLTEKTLDLNKGIFDNQAKRDEFTNWADKYGDKSKLIEW